MPKLDPRKLMEKAIEVMRKSVSEPRADSKTSPMVVAVLWKPDGMGFDERKVQRVLKARLASGLLRRAGRGPATRYEVVRR